MTDPIREAVEALRAEFDDVIARLDEPKMGNSKYGMDRRAIEGELRSITRRALAAHPTPPPPLDAGLLAIAWWTAEGGEGATPGPEYKKIARVAAVEYARLSPAATPSPDELVETAGGLVTKAELDRIEGVTPSPDAGEPQTLDAAWAEALAALPKGWLGPEVSPYYPKGYEAGAHHADTTPGRGRGKRDTGAIYGATAIEALRNLAAYLREHHPVAESAESRT